MLEIVPNGIGTSFLVNLILCKMQKISSYTLKVVTGITLKKLKNNLKNFHFFESLIKYFNLNYNQEIKMQSERSKLHPDTSSSLLCQPVR